jgi:uncharacterized protein
MKIRVSLLATFFLLVTAVDTYAAGFDCTKAASAVEKLICGDAELFTLDEALSKAYAQALERAHIKEEMIQIQRQWLKNQRNACQNAECVRRAYETRIKDLGLSSSSGIMISTPPDRIASSADAPPELSKPQATDQDQPRRALKPVTQKAEALRDFVSFIKDRAYSNSPYEVASSESERLLRFIERTLLSKQITEANGDLHRPWTRDFIAYLRQGHGEYMKISEGIYIVQSFHQMAYLSGVWLADMQRSLFKQLASGYGIEIVDGGNLADGTGWILCRYGGLTRGRVVSGSTLITYSKKNLQGQVWTTPLVDEVSDYSDEALKMDSDDCLCGAGQDRVEGIAGEILERRWMDLNNDGQDELVFRVLEKDCRQRKAPSVELLHVFAVSKGQVTRIHTKAAPKAPANSAVNSDGAK